MRNLTLNPSIKRLHSFIKLRNLPAVLLGAAVAIAPAYPMSAIAQMVPAQPAESEATQLTNAKAVTQEFITLLVQRKFEQARQYLNPSGRESWTAQDLEQKWQRLLQKVGPLKNIAQIRPTVLLGNYTVLVVASFRDSTSDFIITLDSNRKITAFDFLWLGDIQKNAEEFSDALSTGKYGVARSFLTPRLKKVYSPEILKQRWETRVATLGAFKRRVSSKVVKSSSSDVVVVNLEFEKTTGSFMVIFNPLGEIVGIDFPPQQP